MEDQRLFLPVSVGAKELKNRIVVPPMVDFGMGEEDGFIHKRHMQRYRSYAEGGAGMVIIEACFVSDMPASRNGIALFRDSCIPGLTKLAQAAKANDTVALVQLLNNGLGMMEETEIAQISREKFLHYKEDFISAAIRCKQAGFDGVELHAAHGYYLNQIVETSTRGDEYGGTLENRVRILSELISEMKASCGREFLVSVRFGNADYQELGQTAEMLEKAGADILNVSSGCSAYRDVPEEFGYDSRIYAAAWVKKHVKIPVICVGGIVNGAQAEDILQKGYADLVAVGRGHLCDPQWGKKVLAGERPNPCLRCKRCLWYIDGRKCPAQKK